MCANWNKSFNAFRTRLSTCRNWVFPIFLITTPVICAWFVYCATKTKHRPKLADLAFRDPEFSGFSLVRCPSPYLEQTSASPNQFCLLPVDLANGAQLARQILTDLLDPCDVIVASYPKSGTTWVSEAVYLMVNRLDWHKAASSNLEERVPYMEYMWPGAHAIAGRSSPRIIKTHLPFDHLPKSVQCGQAARIIYITRDPRDTVVSYYHFAKSFLPAGYRHKEGLAGFVNRFLDDRLPYSPWVNHVQSYIKAAAYYSTQTKRLPDRAMSPKVLVITYEMLKSDTESALRKIEQFLHATWTNCPSSPSRPDLLTSDQMAQLCAHCSFETMSRNPMTNFGWMKTLGLWSDQDPVRFMRQGSTGNYRQWLQTEQSDQIAQKACQAGLDWTLIDH